MNVAVIGAGISGLAAAVTLRGSGAQVRVFDKARGPGGRMASRRDGNYVFDHGAQYLTVSDNRFHMHVEDWVQLGLVQAWSGRLGVSDADDLRPGPNTQARYVGTPRMSALTRYLSEGFDAAWGTVVTGLRRSNQSWFLDLGGEEEGPFDAVILTTPPEQAVPLLSASPRLAAKARAVTMLPCWALMLAFRDRLQVDYDGVFVNGGALSWVARNSSKPGRPETESWVIHASHTWSKEHLELEKDAVGPPLTAAFFDALRLGPTEPLRTQAHRWRFAQAASPLNRECLWDEEAKIAVAGDWVHAGNVEGAFLSGIGAAEAVMSG